MSVLSARYPTMLDIARRTDPNGNIASIVEIMNDQNPVLQDMTVQECNNRTMNKSTIRTGLPTATWRKLYGGVQPDKSTTTQITDSCGMLEAYSQIDKDEADMAPNKAAFMMSESVTFLEAMNQAMADTLFYGDQSVHPERFTGLAPRYNAIGDDKRKSSYNVIDGGGTEDKNTSVWLCCWGPQTMFGLYPAGSKAGFSHKDLGEVTEKKEDGSMYQVYRAHYKWDLGLCVRDWRYAVRVANIDTEKLAAGTGPDVMTLLVKAYHKLPTMSLGKPVIYCNRTVATYLDLQVLSKSTLALKTDEVQGKPVTMFRGIPIHVCDALLDTEAAVAHE